MPPEVQDKVNEMSSKDMGELAWDLVLYSTMGATEILHQYGLSVADLPHLEKVPMFVAETNHARKALKEDPDMAVHRIAKAYLMTDMKVLHDLASSTLVDARDRIKAIDMMQKLAGVRHMEDDSNKRTGPSVNINFGESMGKIMAASAKHVVIDNG